MVRLHRRREILCFAAAVVGEDDFCECPTVLGWRRKIVCITVVAVEYMTKKSATPKGVLQIEGYYISRYLRRIAEIGNGYLRRIF